jgi:hypothetical protein
MVMLRGIRKLTKERSGRKPAIRSLAEVGPATRTPAYGFTLFPNSREALPKRCFAIRSGYHLVQSLIRVISSRHALHFHLPKLVVRKNGKELRRLCNTAICISGLVVWTSLCAEASDFEIAGTVAFGYTNAGRCVCYQKDSFAMSVKEDGRWYLTQTPISFIDRGQERKDLSQSVVTSSDLTNLYLVKTFSTNRLRWVGPPGAPVPTNLPPAGNSQWATIGRGFIPYGLSDTKIYALWYGFGSERYFVNAAADYLPPIMAEDNEGTYSRDCRVHARYRLATTTPKLPTSIQFSIYHRYMGEDVAQRRKDIFDSTNCLFSVRSFTNVGSLTFPAEITAEFFGFPVSSNYFASVPVGTISILVTNVGTAPIDLDFKPEITGTAVVSDLRPISFDGPVGLVLGPVTNWPAAETGKAKYDRLVQAYKHNHNVRRWHLWTFRLVLLLLVTSPLVVYWRKYSQKANVGPHN